MIDSCLYTGIFSRKSRFLGARLRKHKLLNVLTTNFNLFSKNKYFFRLKCIKKVLKIKQLCIKQIRPDDSLDEIKAKICKRYSFPSSHIDLKPQIVSDNRQQLYHKTLVKQRKIAFITFAFTGMLVPVLMDRDQ